jgi:hypothetical protein
MTTCLAPLLMHLPARAQLVVRSSLQQFQDQSYVRLCFPFNKPTNM